MNLYIIDFSMITPTGMDVQSTIRVRADHVEMAEAIFYDAHSQEFPQEDWQLVDVGTYEYNK